MRLVKAVKRLEERADGAARDAAGADCVYGICWSSEYVKVDRSTVRAGQFVAQDMTITGYCGGVPQIRMVERVTSEADDLGWVYNVAGEEIGRMVEIDGPYFSYCLREGCGGEALEWGKADTRGDGGSGA